MKKRNEKGRQNKPPKNWLSSVIDDLPEKLKFLGGEKLAQDWLTRKRWPARQIKMSTMSKSSNSGCNSPGHGVLVY